MYHVKLQAITIKKQIPVITGVALNKENGKKKKFTFTVMWFCYMYSLACNG